MGEKLKLLRLSYGYTQADLANRLHVSRQTISNWEREHAIPDVDNLKMLSEFYDIDIDYLLSNNINILYGHDKDDIRVVDKNLTIFLYFLSVASLLTPLASFVLLYLTLQSKKSISTKSYKYLFVYSLTISILSVSLLIIFILFLV